MADEATESAATPSQETAPTTEDAALESIRSKMNRETEAPAEETTPEEAPEDSDLDGESTAEDEAETPEKSETEETEDENQPDEKPADTEDQDEDVEVPDTLSALAEHFSVDPADLAGHLQVEMTDADGKVQTMSVAEALRGTLRESDYTAKTTALAEERRAYEATTTQSNEAFSAKMHQADNLLNVLAQELNAGPTDEQLMELLDPNSMAYDVEEYQRQKATRDYRAQQIQGAMAQREQARQEAAKTQSDQLAQWRVDQQRNLQNWYPDSKDPEKLGAFEKGVREYLTNTIHPQAQYSPEEVDNFFNTFDARQALIIKDAMAYRQLQSNTKPTKKTLKALPKVGKPTAPKPRSDSAKSMRSKSQSKLRKEGGRENAIEMIRHMIPTTR